MESKRKPITYITHAAIIAALYVVLTYLAQLLGLASQAVQLRFSEALTILPYFTPAAVPGLFAGCLLANLLTGCAFWDVVFGSIATLLGALGTYFIFARTQPAARHPRRWLAPLPPILANELIVPWVIYLVYPSDVALPFLFLTVGAGEILSCGFLGLLLLHALEPHTVRIFGS